MENGTIPSAATFNYSHFDLYEITQSSKKKGRRGRLQKGDDGENNPVEEKKFKCPKSDCQSIFTTLFKLNRHKAIHSHIRRFPCNSCNRRFTRKDHLKNHLQVHNPNKILHTCQFCQKTYCSIFSYKKHVAFHAADSGDLVCKICQKMFADRDSIMLHLKVHTGSRSLRGPSERKFPCDRCERSFFTKKDVKRHLVVHTGARNYVCNHCPQRFGRKDHLTRHARQSHKINPWPNNNNMRKYDSPSSISLDNFNNGKVGSINIPTSASDFERLGLSLQEPILDPVKQDAPYDSNQPDLSQTNFGITQLPAENGQTFNRYSDATLLPVTQYLPMSPSYPGVSPLLPHHYLNVSTSSGILPGLGPDVLPPMSGAPVFSSSVTLDVGNPSLPHFSQAFQ